MNLSDYLLVNPEVQEALKNNQPVVALESTIIAHGMPYPKNVQTAQEVEKIVRENGAIPATIAILSGKICIGLNNQQLEYLGNTKDVWKVSLRDMPYVLSKKLPGATTVAATMRAAAMVGIRIFVTGGIGGVHREAEKTMDISADLTEMASTSVAVVSAGVKSILDIGLTLEYLETLGIPVITYGQDAFPSFYSRESGYQSPMRLDSSDEIAGLIKTKWDIGLNGSVMIANPVPANQEVKFDVMENYINDALLQAKKNNISGKKVTPFLLSYLAQQTHGNSLNANIALVKNNAEIGAQIAVSLGKLNL